MGEARRRKLATESGVSFALLDAKLGKLGVNTAEFGFYDQPAFMALERANPLALELYSSWVLARPRSEAYDAHVRATVLKLASLIEGQLAATGTRGACLNVATAMARMLDRLGVWSFTARGSLTVEIPTHPEIGRRYFPESDFAPNPDSVTGHGWLIAPPFIVVDPTLRHQFWVDLQPAIAELLPAVVAAEAGEVVQPRWFDTVSDKAVAMNGFQRHELNGTLPYRFNPGLARVERTLPGRDIRIGELSLRYIAGSMTVSEQPLAEIPPFDTSSPDLTPARLWVEHVAPAFDVAGALS
jgi:hypothetical protein